MNLDALPQTVLIILTEFAVGSLVATLLVQWRGMAPEGYVRLSAGIVVVGAALALLAAANAGDSEVEDYALRDGLFGPIRVVLSAFLVLSLMYAVLVLAGERQRSLRAGPVAAALGLSALALIAYQVSLPTWSFLGTLLSFLAGAAALGFVNQSMVLGHWYLVTPKLAGKPLQELTFVLLLVVASQTVLSITNAAIPARDVPDSAALLAGSLATNPAFWLRVGIGLLFALALSYMAWRSSLEDAMMSATGLLYIAVGAVFAGEILARGLLFVTGSPV